MIVFPEQVDVMCSKTNVTRTSLQIHNASSHCENVDETATQGGPSTDSCVRMETVTSQQVDDSKTSENTADTIKTSRKVDDAMTSQEVDILTSESVDDTMKSQKESHTATSQEMSDTMTSPNTDGNTKSKTVSNAVTSQKMSNSKITGACESPDVISECDEIQRVPLRRSDKKSDRHADVMKRISFDDVATNVTFVKRAEHRMKNPLSANPGTVEDCSKLLCQLSKELALLHGLSHGIGVDTDCQRLREELHYCQHRACTLARRNSASIVPLVRRKTSLPTEEIAKVEKMYRIYSGSLEYLLYLLKKVGSLLTYFQQNQEAGFFIRTGISDPVDIPCKPAGGVHTVEESYLHYTRKGSTSNAQPAVGRDLMRLSGDIQSMQQLQQMVTNACDMHPWHVGEECEEEEQDKDDLRPRTLSFRRSTKRHSRRSGRASKPTEEEKGKLLQENVTGPDVTQSPASTPALSQTSKGKRGTWCCVCRLLCGPRDGDTSPEEEAQIMDLDRDQFAVHVGDEIQVDDKGDRDEASGVDVLQDVDGRLVQGTEEKDTDQAVMGNSSEDLSSRNKVEIVVTDCEGDARLAD